MTSTEPPDPRADHPGADAAAQLLGALELPDGTWVRGRALHESLPTGPEPTFGVYLGASYRPGWPYRWIVWPDFRLPAQPRHAVLTLREAHRHALQGGRLEIACRGGRGRTGTALAVLAVLSGVDAWDAVGWVREHYHPRAVETWWQRRWVHRLPGLLASLDTAPPGAPLGDAGRIGTDDDPSPADDGQAPQLYC